MYLAKMCTARAGQTRPGQVQTDFPETRDTRRRRIVVVVCGAHGALVVGIAGPRQARAR